MPTQVEQLIRSKIESPEPQNTILRVLKESDGKQLTERTIKRLCEETGDDSIRLRKQYGMTMIEWGGYGMTGGREGGSLLVAHREKNVTIDTAAIEHGNVAYFSALVERNRKRQATLKKTDKMERLQSLIDQFVKLREEIMRMLAHGGPFDTDNYAIRDMIGETKLI